MTAQQLETWMPLVAIFLVFASMALHKVKKAPNPMTSSEAFANLAVFIIWRFIFFAGGVSLLLWVFTNVSSFIPWKLQTSVPVILAAVFVADFLYYWKHRFEHRVNLLWAQHAVHHSSEEFNLSTSLRLPWLGSYFSWPFFLPALIFGFTAEQILIGYQLVLTYQYLVHTEYIGNLGFLEKLINTPSNHRVHHGRNEIYLDKNYGGILIIWDRLFGTYSPETTPVEYGTITRVISKNPLWINWQPWSHLFEHTKSLPLIKKSKLLFIAPANTQDFLNPRV